MQPRRGKHVVQHEWVCDKRHVGIRRLVFGSVVCLLLLLRLLLLWLWNCCYCIVVVLLLLLLLFMLLLTLLFFVCCSVVVVCCCICSVGCWLDVKDAESSLLLVVVIYMWRLQTAHFGGNSPAMCYRVHSTWHTMSHNMNMRCCCYTMWWCDASFGDDRSRFMVTKQARTWGCIYKKLFGREENGDNESDVVVVVAAVVCCWFFCCCCFCCCCCCCCCCWWCNFDSRVLKEWLRSAWWWDVNWLWLWLLLMWMMIVYARWFDVVVVVYVYILSMCATVTARDGTMDHMPVAVRNLNQSKLGRRLALEKKMIRDVMHERPPSSHTPHQGQVVSRVVNRQKPHTEH